MDDGRWSLVSIPTAKPEVCVVDAPTEVEDSVILVELSASSRSSSPSVFPSDDAGSLRLESEGSQPSRMAGLRLTSTTTGDEEEDCYSTHIKEGEESVEVPAAAGGASPGLVPLESACAPTEPSEAPATEPADEPAESALLAVRLGEEWFTRDDEEVPLAMEGFLFDVGEEESLGSPPAAD